MRDVVLLLSCFLHIRVEAVIVMVIHRWVSMVKPPPLLPAECISLMRICSRRAAADGCLQGSSSVVSVSPPPKGSALCFHYRRQQMSVPAAAAQNPGDREMQSAAVSPSFLPSQGGKIPGRKRGRPPLRNNAKMDFTTSRYPESLPPLKVPKKRGRKPGFKLKPRMVMTPLAISPPSSTPEPDMSSIPQDAATVPHSATPQVLTVCIYINKQANTGPNLDRKKILQLPDHFGPDRPSVVLQQAVQGCIDSAFLQKTVFTLLTQGYGGEKISATFDGKQHLLSLPVVNSIDYVLRFLKKLCRSLHCENLFSDQPISTGAYASDGREDSEIKRNVNFMRKIFRRSDKCQHSEKE
ncbi:sex comb on midleg-like protein 4 [Pseudochaenichthys georgianus]|uniref:sex comb on midleg-like protein 4 n=1 Tax=Pseudochaenichthys georgianus TaxID=52239 RepID=UPI00146A561F|nr:sex comb on midleg-like protein 4 [Pseudochaenichthys georgianus]